MMRTPDAAAQLGAAVTVYLDGGPTTSNEVSTIVDCTGDEPLVLRAGAISWDDIGHYQKIVKILAETDRIMKEIELPLD